MNTAGRPGSYGSMETWADGGSGVFAPEPNVQSGAVVCVTLNEARGAGGRDDSTVLKFGCGLRAAAAAAARDIVNGAVRVRWRTR